MPVDYTDILDDIFTAYHGALTDLKSRLGDSFAQAVEMILSHQGSVIVSGMGKSGLVGRKISATLSSTGTPSIFLHPAEAMHGDLGIVRKGDVMIAISNSGETEELIRLLPALRRLEVNIIGLVGNCDSQLGRASVVCLDSSVDREACPLDLAPTTSSLTTLVLGDALAIALMDRRGFKPADFAATHPGGKLGKQLLNKVCDHMRTADLPFVPADMPMSEVIVQMTKGRLGLALVGTTTDFKGIITDGDLRRMLVEGHDLRIKFAGDVMNPTPQTVPEDMLYGRAEEIMSEARIQCLVVRSAADKIVGIIQIF